MKKPPSGSGAKKTKDYYLKDIMQFITPFMKSKPQQGNLPTETEPIFNEDDHDEAEAETDNDVNDNHLEQEITASVTNSQNKQTDIKAVVTKSQEKNPSTQAQCSNTASNGLFEKRRKVSTTTNEADKYFIEYVKSKTSTTQPNPDLQFLTSLLPDVAKLTDYQKRQFKRKTLELLDELLCDGPFQNNTMMVVPMPTPSPAYSSYSTQSSVSTNSTREYGEQAAPVQTYIQTFSPNISDTTDFSL